MEIALRPDLQEFVASEVRAGEYADAEEVVNGALSLLQAQEALTAGDIEELREVVAVGLDQLKRGQTAEFTADDIIREGRAILTTEEQSRR